MPDQIPRVSIGLPVYNGEKLINRALDSILAQIYTDFELIISDNASTDKTQEICLSYAKKDTRIRYYRNEVNLGLARNFNRVFELSQGEYFVFASHDDYKVPDFIEKCITILDSDPSIVLCQGLIVLVSESGEHIHYDEVLMFPNENSPSPHKRFRDLIMIPHLCIDDYGLMRSAALRKIKPLYKSHIGSDRNMLAELSLHGKFYHTSEIVYYWQDMRSRDLPFDQWAARLDTAKAHKIPMPAWSNLIGYLQSATRADIDVKERLLCYVHIAEWIPKYARPLVKDVIRGARLKVYRWEKRIFMKALASDQGKSTLETA